MAAIVAQDEQPISRTYQYRKVMKPMLERKRRARINRCLDELKELLVGALQAEGESVSRLEKADVLELTVRHLHKLRRSQAASERGEPAERFRAGFLHCANEVSKYMTTLNLSRADVSVSSRLISHLDHCVRSIEVSSQHYFGSGGSLLVPYTPPSSPVHSGKLFAIVPAGSCGSSEGPISPPHFQHLKSPFGNHHLQQEPFDLSNSENVWRPW